MPTPSPWHRGTHRRRAEKVVANANANPSATCWRCGLTLAQHKPGDRWTAGHIIDSTNDTPLLAEAASCNFRAGARKRNANAKANAHRSNQWR